MKNSKLFLLVAIIGCFSACEDEEAQFDTRNGTSFAQFNGLENQTITINPTAATENVITVGASTLSDNPRSVVVEIDTLATTLDESFYNTNLEGLSIPAGSFSTDIIIETPATDVFPDGSDVLVLNLISVFGVDSLFESSVTKLTLSTTVECPSVDITALAGTYNVVNHRFDDFFDPPVASRTIELGPEENQITIVEGAVAQDNADPLILDIDPATGSVSYGGSADAIHFNTFGPGAYGNVSGSVLTCIGLVDITIQTDGFIDNFLTLRKQ